jgi:hypothetical protein
MTEGLVTFKVDDSGFGKLIQDYASAALINIRQAFTEQGMLLANELVQRTPPFAGRKLKRMMELKDQKEQLAAAGGVMGPFVPKAQFKDPDIENMTALKIGKRRVEKDIRRVIYGLRGAKMPAKNPKTVQQINAQTYPGGAYYGKFVDWGVMQKCQNKQAVRVYATKEGKVYGVDYERYKPHATIAEMRKTHQEHRISRGHVTTAGQRDLIVGRWRWLNVLVTQEKHVKEFIRYKQNFVGQAKGGWAVSFIALGGSLSPKGWVGKHAYGSGVPKVGECKANMEGENMYIRMVNSSAWASGGDSDRIREGAVAGRARALAANIKRKLEALWGNRARRKGA